MNLKEGKSKLKNMEDKIIDEVEEKLKSLKVQNKICGWGFELCDKCRIRFWIRSKTVAGFLTFFDKYSFNVADGFADTSYKLDEFFNHS